MGIACSRNGVSAASPTPSSPQSSPSGGAVRSSNGNGRYPPQSSPSVGAVKSSNGSVHSFTDGIEVKAAKAEVDHELSENNMLGSLPPFFLEILEDLERHQRILGGTKHFRERPHIEKKITRQELTSSHSDYEYVYLTVLGLARLHMRAEEIIRRNNGMPFNRNPGVQLLEQITGFTMHAERDGANHVLRQAPASLVEAYQLARAETGGTLTFYKSAFDRTADPCLEGRFGRIMDYIERRRASLDPKACRGPSWEDVSLKTLPEDAPAQEVVGEHLRVFIAECTWQWAQQHGLSYEDATGARQQPEHVTDFSRLFNAISFEAAMVARGVVIDTGVFQWESADKSGEWVPYEPDISRQIDLAHQRGIAEIRIRLGPKCWQYIIDFNKMVQRNPKTGMERPLRNVDAASSGARTRPGQLTLDILQQSILYFVDMQTLPPTPGVPGQATPKHSMGTSSTPPTHETIEAPPRIGDLRDGTEVPPDPTLLPVIASSEPAQQPLNAAPEEVQQEVQHNGRQEEAATQQEMVDGKSEETPSELKLVDVP